MTEHRILVPTDLTESGDAALNYARVFRDNLGSSITVLHAEEPLYVAGMPDIAVAAYEPSEEDRKRLAARLDEHVRKHLAPPFDARIVSQFAVAAILQASGELKPSLIIMGTHGRAGWRRLLQGSIAEEIVHLATCPILTVGPRTDLEAQPRIETILCPVNLTPVALSAFREAATLAAAFGARLVAVYVAERDETVTAEIEERLESLVEPGIRHRFRYDQIIRTGDAAERILETADQLGADLLVIGAQHRRFRDETIVGSTTGRVIRFAPCAVMTVIRRAEVAKTESAAA